MNDLKGLHKQLAVALENGMGLAGEDQEFFWESLAPISEGKAKVPEAGSPLGDALISAFGSADALIEYFRTNAGALQGSGWGWLVYNKETDGLEYYTTAN